MCSQKTPEGRRTEEHDLQGFRPRSTVCPARTTSRLKRTTPCQTTRPVCLASQEAKSCPHCGNTACCQHDDEVGLFQPGELFGLRGSWVWRRHRARSNDLTEADDAMSNISSRMSRLASGESAAPTPGAQLSANINESRGQRQLTERQSQIVAGEVTARSQQEYMMALLQASVPARSGDDTTHRSGTQQGGHD